MDLGRFFIYMEVWKDIKDYEGLYQVSNLGRVKRLESTITHSNGQVNNYKGGLLKGESVKGYVRVSLCKQNKVKRFFIHRLVALNFMPNVGNKPCVNHKDGNPSNNNITNLEWCTHKENEIHSYDVLCKINANRKLTNENVLFIRKNKDLYTRKYLASMFNVDVSTIYNVLKNRYYENT